MFKEIENKKYCRKEEYLPKKLIKKLNEDIFNNSNYEYRTKNNFLKCIGIIYHKQVSEYHGQYSYVALGRSYWKTVFGGDYHAKVIYPLLELQIIESMDFGYRSFPDKDNNTNRGKEKGLVGVRYRINPELTDDDCDVISYLNPEKAISAEESMFNDGHSFIYTGISDKNFKVSIDRDKAISWLDCNADKICKDYLHTDYIISLPENLAVEYKEFLEEGSYNTRYASVRSAKLIAETKGKEFFYYKDTFYIANIEKFLEHRIQGLKYDYKREISRVGNLPIEDKRSEVTLRLHNYLVNFPSKILQFITINNKTVHQLDLRTSQFLIFANLLNVYLKFGEPALLNLFKDKKTRTYIKRLCRVLQSHKPLLPVTGVDISDPNSGLYSNSDVIKFIRDVFFKDFYSEVQKDLELKTRGLAKAVLFKLLFKKTNRKDALLDRLNLHYPIVMSIITEFKKPDNKKNTEKWKDDSEDRASNFSVFLQCVEAELFIDNILLKLRDLGVPCFSRHDSLVVANGDEKVVEIFAKSVFAGFGFKYNQKTDDMFLDAVDYLELEDSGYLEWLVDENELNIVDYINETQMNYTYNTTDAIFDYSEEEILIFERLNEIGFRDDYTETIDIEFLEEISTLPCLSTEERNTLYDDIINLRSGISFLQDDTNIVIQRLCTLKY